MNPSTSQLQELLTHGQSHLNYISILSSLIFFFNTVGPYWLFILNIAVCTLPFFFFSPSSFGFLPLHKCTSLSFVSGLQFCHLLPPRFLTLLLLKESHSSIFYSSIRFWEKSFKIISLGWILLLELSFPFCGVHPKCSFFFPHYSCVLL